MVVVRRPCRPRSAWCVIEVAQLTIRRSAKAGSGCATIRPSRCRCRRALAGRSQTPMHRSQHSRTLPAALALAMRPIRRVRIQLNRIARTPTLDRPFSVKTTTPAVPLSLMQSRRLIVTHQCPMRPATLPRSLTVIFYLCPRRPATARVHQRRSSRPSCILAQVSIRLPDCRRSQSSFATSNRQVSLVTDAPTRYLCSLFCDQCKDRCSTTAIRSPHC